MNYTNQYYSNFLGWIVPFGLIPINEIYAWSNNEKIHILFHKIGELIKTSNIYGESMVEILKWIEDNKDAIKKTLAEMAENGELTDIVNDILNENPDIITDALARNPELLTNAVKEQIETMLDNGSLNDVLAEVLAEVDDLKHSYIELSRKWRAMYEAHSQTSDTYDEVKYSALQGCCHFDYNGTGYIAFYLYCSNSSHGNKDDNGRIRIYREDGTFVIEKEVSWGHCNSFAFDETNGWLYGAVSSTYNGQASSTYSNDIKRLKFTGSSLGNEQTRTVSVTDHINGVSWYNNQLYVCKGLHIWKFNWDTAVAVNEIDIAYSGYGTLAGWAFTDDYIYCGLYKPSGILRINRHTMLIDWVYYIRPIQNQGMFFLGEIEGISVDHNNNLWVMTFQRMQNLSNLTHHMAQVFVQNLDRHDILPTRVRTHMEDVDKIVVSLTSSVSGVTPRYDAYNPNGTEEYPFVTIQEALWFGDNAEDIKNIRISMRRDETWYTTVSTRKNVWIEGNDDKTLRTTGGFDVQLCPYFRISWCEVRNYHPAPNTSPTGTNPAKQNCTSSIYAIGGVVVVGHCYLRNYNTYNVYDDDNKLISNRYGVYGNGILCHGVSNTYGTHITDHTHSVTSNFTGDWS